MIETPTYTLSIYGLSSANGFLPDRSPLDRLHDPYFNSWENLISNLPERIATKTIRSRVDQLPVLDTTRLHNEPDWRRAYVVLSFLTHAYIWGGTEPSQKLPPSIVLPFLKVADHFALPMTAAYAATNLWNWKPSDVDADITNPDNVHILNTFTGTSDEAWFYAISVSIEAKGGLLVSLMLECFEAVRVADTQTILSCFRKATKIIQDLNGLLERMTENCDPNIFYHQIRPFLAGSKDMAKAGLPTGVMYDEGAGSGRWRQYSGGSNAQSSLIQMLDIMLGIEHESTGNTSPGAGCSSMKRKHSYIREMRNYMPGPHRHFLSYAANNANIRAYVLDDLCDPLVRSAYQNAVASFTVFRDTHIKIVSRYIINPAKRSRFNVTDGHSSMNLATSSSWLSKTKSQQEQLSGTGGTALMPFLKQTRDETKRAGKIEIVQ